MRNKCVFLLLTCLFSSCYSRNKEGQAGQSLSVAAKDITLKETSKHDVIIVDSLNFKDFFIVKGNLNSSRGLLLNKQNKEELAFYDLEKKQVVRNYNPNLDIELEGEIAFLHRSDSIVITNIGFENPTTKISVGKDTFTIKESVVEDVRNNYILYSSTQVVESSPKVFLINAFSKKPQELKMGASSSLFLDSKESIFITQQDLNDNTKFYIYNTATPDKQDFVYSYKEGLRCFAYNLEKRIVYLISDASRIYEFDIANKRLVCMCEKTVFSPVFIPELKQILCIESSTRNLIAITVN